MPSLDFYSPRGQLYAAALLMEAKLRRTGGDILVRYRDDGYGFITQGIGQCAGDSWRGWRIVLKAVYGIPLDEDELVFFKSVAGDRNPPKKRVKEFWAIVGRRGGKDSVASMIALENARAADRVALRPGENALVACFATDKGQARIVHGYIRGYFEEIPALQRWLAEDLKKLARLAGPVLLTNRTEIRVTTNNFRAPRGWPIVCAIFDECAFYRDENSATPDFETYRAVEPGMLSIPDAMIVGISSPYRESGLLYKKYEDHFGVDDDDVLVIQAPSIVMNPTLNQRVIGKAIEEDPEAKSAEYLAQFRKDLADYIQKEVVEEVTPRNLKEIPPTAGREYRAFTDPSGGSRDSMTLAIAHAEGEKAVLDGVWEHRAPFSPEAVVDDLSQVCLRYGVNSVKGDHYGGEWPRERFTKNGITYEVSEESKSEIYRRFLPILNSRKCQLLDILRLKNQLLSLERRTARGGRDSIDHPPGGRDDVINAAAGVCVMVAGDPLAVWDRLAA